MQSNNSSQIVLSEKYTRCTSDFLNFPFIHIKLVIPTHNNFICFDFENMEYFFPDKKKTNDVQKLDTEKMIEVLGIDRLCSF